MHKFVGYAERFSRIENPEYINEVRKVLTDPSSVVDDTEPVDLKPFEIAQLGNLCPKNPEEAISIIPR